MRAKEHSLNAGRTETLGRLLYAEREQTLARVRQYRAAQEEEALVPPADELDAARSLADVETHASLIDRAEKRLYSIDRALDLLQGGRYGVCVQCGDEIPLERLKALPFAAYCVDCQGKRNRARRLGEGTIDEPFAHQWDLPEGMTETTESSQDEFLPLREEGVEPMSVVTPRKRRRAVAAPSKPAGAKTPSAPKGKQRKTR